MGKSAKEDKKSKKGGKKDHDKGNNKGNNKSNKGKKHYANKNKNKNKNKSKNKNNKSNKSNKKHNKNKDKDKEKKEPVKPGDLPPPPPSANPITYDEIIAKIPTENPERSKQFHPQQHIISISIISSFSHPFPNSLTPPPLHRHHIVQASCWGRKDRDRPVCSGAGKAAACGYVAAGSGRLSAGCGDEEAAAVAFDCLQCCSVV